MLLDSQKVWSCPPSSAFSQVMVLERVGDDMQPRKRNLSGCRLGKVLASDSIWSTSEIAYLLRNQARSTAGIVGKSDWSVFD